MSLFNSGYSRQTTLGENLIQGEDPSDKILEEGKKYLQQWKTNSEAEQTNQKNYEPIRLPYPLTYGSSYWSLLLGFIHLEK